MGWSRAPDVLWRVAPSFLALAKVDGTATVVAGPGSDVWDLLESSRDLDAIVDELVRRYQADRDVIVRDVTRLLDDLEKSGHVTHDG